MRFSIATTVLSLAATVIAIPNTLALRNAVQSCSGNSQTLSCCQSTSVTNTSGGLLDLGTLLGVACTPLDLSILDIVGIPDIGAGCANQPVCCGNVPLPACDDDGDDDKLTPRQSADSSILEGTFQCSAINIL